jgi:hypothetical protein
LTAKLRKEASPGDPVLPVLRRRILQQFEDDMIGEPDSDAAGVHECLKTLPHARRLGPRRSSIHRGIVGRVEVEAKGAN